VDDPVTDYLPRLKGSAYAQASLRNILQMASGVSWNEDYADPESDVNQVNWDTLSLQDFLGKQSRVAEPGTVFNYSTAESNLVGSLLRSAIGNNLSTYLEQKIWQPFGMEADAAWSLTESGGGEFGGCCISATLRDYARLGLFALGGGKLADGTPVLADGWMQDSVTPSPAAGYYGYQWWLMKDRVWRASGVFGQGIFVAPEACVVIALKCARPDASRDADWWLHFAMFHAIVAALQE
jgi:CubicO group peptidase (beta-lactamase class C family)